MRRALATALAALALVAFAPHATAASRVQLIVRLEAPAGAATRAVVARALGGEPGLVVSSDTFVVTGAMAGARLPRGVRWSAPDTVYRAEREPTDACYRACPVALDGERELITVGAAAAWDITTGSSDVIVAVLDGTVDATHQDLVGKVSVGPSFVTDPCADASDAEISHATGVAGLAGANTDNGVGIASLGWETSVLSVGVLDPCGIGTASEVSAGIRYATDAGARVINLSLAGKGNPALEDAVRYAREKGALVIAASGNSGSAVPSYPAAYEGVLAVGSTDPDGTAVSTFSNHGSWVDLVAPGESIASTATLPGGYASYDGTSFASPIVAAAAALVFALHPSFTGDDVAARLTRSAVSIEGGTAKRLDAAAAVVDPPGGFVLVAADGGAFTFGDAVYRGSAGALKLNQPIVAAAAAGTTGYWEAASDGGVFAYGVPFRGSMGGTRLNQPIVGMASTPSGKGYWLVASDGGIFTFGDAVFAGSAGAIPLSSPVVGMAAASGSAYWLAAADGGVFTFGGARFRGSAVGRAGSAVVGIAAAPDGAGYWLATADGIALTFGDAFDGARTGPLNQPIVAIGAT